MAAKSGADALIVSNHGGRQLDGAESSIAILPEIVDRVGQDIEIWMDGGIRSGQDMLKAIALATNGLIVLCDDETFKGWELKIQYGITKLGGLLITISVAIGIIMGDPEGFYKIEPKI